MLYLSWVTYSTAFVGLCVYCLFATSKDISIGPTGMQTFIITHLVVALLIAPYSCHVTFAWTNRYQSHFRVS